MTQQFWIAGTDTDIGKTLVTTIFMRYFQAKGAKVAPYKPIQTGVGVDGISLSDTEFYKSFSEVDLVEEDLNSYSFNEPASPHYAARLEKVLIDEGVILQHIKDLLAKYDVVICEGAGGLFVPIDDQCNYHFVHLIKQSQLPVLLVASTRLGTINHTLLSVEALKKRGIPIVGIVFNSFGGTELETDNIRTIEQMTSLPSVVIPQFKDLSEITQFTLDITKLLERLTNR
ncbi:dethiobiotin synthase [Fredinandcohnia quinoae]|uniref:ATP-dependent dethiobiotin synthetase BioD n=1 Tax=Fredinandcohnia quinoae TaxID=2918902 RepID=A0AAW5E2Q9_9BACI|nr:dethiobiotin synthase [Fredinandcohnia sp. SECRCQ15]MCH1624372.1 dethiobiotin synthase [Fredinandcohnia sp. SECRCQ15]